MALRVIFSSFIVVELIRFFHGAIQLCMRSKARRIKDIACKIINISSNGVKLQKKKIVDIGVLEHALDKRSLLWAGIYIHICIQWKKYTTDFVKHAKQLTQTATLSVCKRLNTRLILMCWANTPHGVQRPLCSDHSKTNTYLSTEERTLANYTTWTKQINNCSTLQLLHNIRCL